MAASSSDAPSTGGFDPLPHGALTAEVRTQLRPAAFCDVMARRARELLRGALGRGVARAGLARAASPPHPEANRRGR